jgi:outer membrane protein TolC
VIAAIVFAAVTAVPREFTGLPLQSALQNAVTHSPDVAQAQERVNENAALLAAARGIRAPALVANYAMAPQAGNTNNTVLQRLTTVGGQITLGDYLAYGATVRQAYFTLAGSQFDLLDAQRAERIKVIGQYYTALKAVATVGLQRAGAQSAQRDLRSAQLRYRAGDAPRLDVVRAQVALAQAQSNVEAAQVDLANAQDALAVETSRPLAVFSRLTAATGVPAPPADPQRAIVRALAVRSDLMSARQAVRAEEAAVSVAQRAVLPAITVNAGYTTGVDTGIPVHGPSASVNVALPISHTASDRTAAERARLAQAQYRAAAIQRRITVDVGAAARTYAETIRAVASATRARVAAQQELQATEIGYRSGASSSLDVETARSTYTQAALSELNAIYAQGQAAATLQEDMGS